MPTIRLTLTLLAVVLLRPGLAQEPEGASIEPSLELAGDASSMVATASHLELGMSATAGSSIRSLSDRWPEDLVIAPIPGRSPQLGWMLSLAGGYFLESKDEEPAAKPSVIGGFGMASENGSYAYGGGANLHLLDDRLRIKAGATYFDIRYRYYGTGVANDLGVGVELLQEAPLYFTEGTWRLWNQLYVGLGLLGGNVDTRPRIAIDESPFLAPSLNVDIAAWSLPIQYDSRDSETYPRRGWLVTGRAMNYRKSLGSDFDAETFKLAVNRYMTVRDRDVLAVRGMIRATNGDAPFFLQSTFGGKTDLRGYPSGRFRDRMMYALQGEYRWQVSDRWVFTGFAGFGEVADSFGDMGENVLPAAGMGARFILSTKHEVGLSADIAVGNDGAEFYFGVGEAF